MWIISLTVHIFTNKPKVKIKKKENHYTLYNFQIYKIKALYHYSEE